MKHSEQTSVKTGKKKILPPAFLESPEVAKKAKLLRNLQARMIEINPSINAAVVYCLEKADQTRATANPKNGWDKNEDIFTTANYQEKVAKDLRDLQNALRELMA